MNIYDSFAAEYYRHFEDCFPIKMIRRGSSKRTNTPWITKGLRTSVRTKHKLYKKYLANPIPYRDSRYKNYKNKLNHVIRIAKKHYYDKSFKLAQSNMKKTWQLINEVINIKTEKTVLPSTFRSGATLITDPTAIANGFCKYFTEIGPSIARTIPSIHSSFHDYLGPAFRETIFLKPVTVTELKTIGMSFKNGKAPGYDHIPMFVIKRSLDWISESLTHLSNTSLETGTFPDKLKLAKKIPIFKTGNADTFTNYRPISILSSFSKIYERVFVQSPS